MGSSSTDAILTEILFPHVGVRPATWSKRVYDVLAGIARDEGRDVESVLLDLVRRPHGQQVALLLDAATVGHTAFFRHPEQFERLHTELTQWRGRRAQPTRIWCAGCSTGEEAYSVALVAEQAGARVRILATDVNPLAIHHARAGAYTRARPGLLPGDKAATHWAAPVRLRDSIRFEVASLLSLDPTVGEGPFDLVFCRNVLIHYDGETIASMFQLLAERLAAPGALVVSPVDSLLPIPPCLGRTRDVGWLSWRSERRNSNAPSIRPPRSIPPRADLPRETSASPQSPIEDAARLLSSGELEGAERLLSALLNDDPDQMAGWFLLGEVLVQRSELAQARAAFCRVARCRDVVPDGVDAETLRWAAARRTEGLKASVRGT